MWLKLRTAPRWALLGSVCVAMLSFRPAPARADDPGISDLEKGILESRRKIWSGEFEIDVSSNDRLNPNTHYHTWFSKEGRIRQELTRKDELETSIFDTKSAFFYRLKAVELPNNPEIPHTSLITMMQLHGPFRGSPHFSSVILRWLCLDRSGLDC